MGRTKGLSIALAAIVAIGSGIIGGCSSKPNDAQLVTNIQSQMFADAQLKSANLQVASIAGEVTLKGTVPSDAARYDAYKIATQTPGVTKVIDQMVADGGSAQADADVNAPAPSQPTPPSPTLSASAPPAAKSKPAPPAKSHVSQQTPPNQSDQKDQDNQEAQLADNSASKPPDILQAASDISPAQPATAPAPAPAATPPPPPKQYELPAGTTVSIRMIDSIDSSVNEVGTVFHASLDAPLMLGGDVVAPGGADVYVRLTSVKSAGKMTGQSQLTLELVRLEYQGQSFPLVSTTYTQAGESRGKDTAKKVGAGAIVGAIIGAAVGGGKGAAIGGTLGAGAGGVYQGTTHAQQVKISSETKLNFQLDQAALITVQPGPADQTQQPPSSSNS